MSTFLVYLCQDASEVSAEFGRITPTPNVTYSFSSSTGTIICGMATSTTATTPTFTAITAYDGCYECNINNIEYSANTPENICVEICTTGGTTTVSVAPPHPVWTNQYGEEVTQMNAVTLGGNGLNS
jgi:hypothetical protein